MKEWLEAIVIGDIHLDKLTGLFPNHLELQLLEVRKALNYALRYGVPHVFFLGDICEHPRLSEEARISLLNLLADYDGKLNIHIILGNHDVQMENIHSLQFFVRLHELGKFQSIHIYDKPTQRVLSGVPVNFLPYPANKPIEYKNSSTVNLGHFERIGALRDNGYSIKKGGLDLPNTKDIWLIGHLHTPQVLKRNYYVGTLYQLNFGESLPKGFAHFKCKYSDGILRHKYEWIENKPSFILTPLRVTNEEQFENIDNNPLHLYKVYVQDGVSLPTNFAVKHPNVIDILGYKDDSELQAISGLCTGDQSEEVTFNLTTGLTDYLLNKGATKKQTKRANRIINSIINKHSKKTK